MGIFGTLSHLRNIDIGGVRAVGVVRGAEAGVAVPSKEFGRRGRSLTFAPLVEEEGKGAEDEQGESPENATHDSADVCGLRRCAHCPARRYPLSHIKVCGSWNGYDGCSSGSASICNSITGDNLSRGEYRCGGRP